MVRQLMPLGDDAPRCNEFARALGVLALGSGLYLDRAVLITVPLPWPKPALSLPWLEGPAAAVGRSAVASRLFAAEPAAPNDEDQFEFEVEVYERRPAPLPPMLYRWKPATVDMIDPLVTAVAATPPGALGELSPAGVTLIEAAAVSVPTFLVCTQGSHDTCCGIDGVALADEIERKRPSYRLRRISHTGGHRFAPTFLAFPEGRMWAFADLALVDRIATATVEPDDLLTRSRGWWGARVGPAQVAETVVRAEAGPDLAGDVTIEIDEPTGGGMSYRCTVSGESTSQRWHVDVHVGRTVPAIACESPGGLPAKPGREFGWTLMPPVTS